MENAMTELEKIEYARSFLERLANGINPLDGLPIPEQDLANNVRLSRCFSYVSELLRQVVENGGIRSSKAAKVHKKDFELTEEERGKLQVSERALTVSEIAERLNGLIDRDSTRRISAASINQWLLERQLLEIVVRPDGKTRKLPTAQGRELGLFTEERTGQYGSYLIVLFAPSAQQFLYDNIEAIAAARHEQRAKREKRRKDDPLAAFHARPWTEAHDARLTELFRNGTAVSDMAFALKRTEDGIRSRLDELGLSDGDRDAD